MSDTATDPTGVEEYEDDHTELTAAELELYRTRLAAERASVAERLARHLNEAVRDNEILPDENDAASRETDQLYLLRLADKEKKLLRQIDRAMAKFETGAFGLCEGTGDPIGRRRLELRPWTRYSIQHKERLERDKAARR